MREIELILKRYHISLKRVVCASYVEGLFSPEDSEIFSMTKKIINGHNPNEVFMKEKTLKNEGFFEKFFNFSIKFVFSSNICCFLVSQFS